MAWRNVGSFFGLAIEWNCAGGDRPGAKVSHFQPKAHPHRFPSAISRVYDSDMDTDTPQIEILLRPTAGKVPWPIRLRKILKYADVLGFKNEGNRIKREPSVSQKQESRLPQEV